MRTLPIDSYILDMLNHFTKRHDTDDFSFGINRHRAWQIVRDCTIRAARPWVLFNRLHRQALYSAPHPYQQQEKDLARKSTPGARSSSSCGQ